MTDQLRRTIGDIIQKHLDLDTVDIEYHREATDMVGAMSREIVSVLCAGTTTEEAEHD